MIRTIALILFLAWAPLSQTRTGNDGTIVARTPYVFAPFEKVEGLNKLVKKPDYDAAVADKRFVMEDLKYISDGLTVEAYLYRPQDIQGKKLPVIIFNRGNYLVGDIGAESVPMFRRLALEGFVVLAPLLRGSHGAAGKDEVGGADLDDVMNTLPMLRSLDFVDQGNLFMYGHSRGGMMTFQAIRDGYPVRAAATVGGFTDFASLVAAHPEQYDALNKQIWPDYAQEKAAIAERRSAVRWADKLNVPLMLMHGGADRAVDPSQTLSLAQLLQKAGKSYELFIANGETHTLSHDETTRDALVAAWFKKYMGQG